MKVLLLTHRSGDLFTGGVAEVIQHLSAVFPRVGVEPIVYTQGECNISSPQYLLNNDTPCYSGPFCKPSWWISAATLKPLQQLITELHINVIHAYGLYRSGFMAMQMKKKCGIPFVVTSHSDILPAGSARIQRPRVKKRCQTILKAADAVTHLTPIMAEASHAIYNTQEKSVCIPNGIDLTQWQKESHWSEKNYLLSIGRLEPEKGFDILIQAYAFLIKQKKVSLPLVIAGSGSSEHFLKNLVSENQLKIACISELPETLQPETVYFTGYVRGKQKQQLIHQCTLMLFATQPKIWEEAFGMIVLEAMAAQKPLIASDTHVNRYFIEEGMHAYLVTADDPNAWANQIDLQLRNSSQHKIDGEKNYALAKKFDWLEIANQYKKVYATLA